MASFWGVLLRARPRPGRVARVQARRRRLVLAADPCLEAEAGPRTSPSEPGTECSRRGRRYPPWAAGSRADPDRRGPRNRPAIRHHCCSPRRLLHQPRRRYPHHQRHHRYPHRQPHHRCPHRLLHQLYLLRRPHLRRQCLRRRRGCRPSPRCLGSPGCSLERSPCRTNEAHPSAGDWATLRSAPSPPSQWEELRRGRRKRPGGFVCFGGE